MYFICPGEQAHVIGNTGIGNTDTRTGADAGLFTSAQSEAQTAIKAVK
jgi:hypothetical protein